MKFRQRQVADLRAQENFEQLERLLSDPWHLVGATGEPAFENSWANRGGSEETAAFRFTGPGVVAIRGSVAAGAQLTNIFTLPTKYRAARERRFAIGGADAGTQHSWLLLRTTGGVQVYMPASVGAIDEAHIEAVIPL